MRIVPFPAHDRASAQASWIVELESALSGTGEGPAAESWRVLREDVRALAAPIDAGFEGRLSARIAAQREPSRRVRKHLRGRLQSPERPVIAAVFAAMAAAVVALLIVAPWRSAPGEHALPLASQKPRAHAHAVEAAPSFAGESAASAAAPGTIARGAPSVNESSASASGGPASAPGRVQQLGASVTLAVAPTEVQPTADRVARLVVSDGGFVQSSHVQVQHAGLSEANLMLTLQAAKLSAALAALEQIAPVRAESQSLQDITDSYDAARRALADAIAERQALLNALSRASTQGQIDSLRERLSQARDMIAGRHSALQAISRHASTAEVEVGVVGDGHASGEGLTLHRGLHDAARVLTVTLVVLLVAAAVLLPLALVLAVLLASRRVWRRRLREHALDTP